MDRWSWGQISSS